MAKKKIRIKDKQLRDLLADGGRKNAKRDFMELLKRAANRTISSS